MAQRLPFVILLLWGPVLARPAPLPARLSETGLYEQGSPETIASDLWRQSE